MATSMAQTRLPGHGVSMEPGPSAAQAGDAQIVLTGHSLIQIVSRVVTASVLDATHRTFAAITATANSDSLEALLLPLTDGTEVPNNARVLARFDITGTSAAELFLNRWLPLPYLRVTQRRGQTVFEDGPSNWARVLITPELDQKKTLAGYRVTTAFDTALADPARNVGRADTAPTLDDLRNSQLFRVPHTPEDAEWFVTEPWVDDWLDEAAHGQIAALTTNDETEPEPRTLAPLAHYLTLLAALDSAECFPDVRFSAFTQFIDGHPSDSAGHREVDLVIALGTDAIAATLSNPVTTPRATPGALAVLGIQDRDRPWLNGTSSISAAAAFARTSFGNDVLSRQSGRPDAFAAPSPLRVGESAENLLRQQPADAPPCGLRDPIAHIGNTGPHDLIWRYGALDGVDEQRQPFVTGPILTRVTETGEPLTLNGNRQSATRARFAPASLTTFAVNEIVQQAIAKIHAADKRTTRDAATVPQKLGRVIVSLPENLLPGEAAEAHLRVSHGVALAAQALAAPGATTIEPGIQYAPGAALCLQHAYLHNEVAFKFANRASAYLKMIANPFADLTAGTARIGTVLVEATTISMLVSTIAATSDATSAIKITPDISDSGGIGTNDMAWAIAQKFVVPAFIAHFTKLRLVDAATFVEALVSARTKGLHRPDARIATRFVDDVLLPAARNLMGLQEQAPVGAGANKIETPLRSLLRDIDTLPVAVHVQDAAVAAGANPVSLGDAILRTSPEEVGATALEVIEAAVRSALSTIRRAHCDVVLVSAGLGVSRTLREIALEEAVARPDRTIDLTNYRFGAWANVGDATGRATDVASMVCVGAAVAGADVPRLNTQPVIVGIADAGLRIADTDVLFTIDAGMDATTEPLPPQSQIVGYSGSPVTLAMRRLDSVQWCGRALALVCEADAAAVRRAAMPLAVTLQFDPASEPSINSLRIKAVRDARGRDLPPTLLALVRPGSIHHDPGTAKGHS